MTEVCEAVYENGVYKPVECRPSFPNGQHVRLTIEPDEKPISKVDVLALMTSFYDGMAPSEIDEITEIILDRGAFFGRTSQEA